MVLHRPHPRRCLIAAVCAAAYLAATAAGAAAAPTVAEFPIPNAVDADSQGIVLGPDGRLYFTQKNAARIGRVTPGDPPTIESFDLPQAPATFTNPDWITVGPDGNIWFTASVNNAGGVGKLSPANPAAAQGFGGFGISDVRGIAAGFDGNLWVMDSGNGRIVRVNPATGLSINDDVNFPSFTSGRGIARGPDGNMWAASFGTAELARIPPNGGTPTEFDAGGNAWSVVAGPDGNIWYTVPDAGVGQMNPATGGKTVFPPSDPAGDLFGIAVGADGALWAARAVANDIARVTTSGSFSFFPALTAAARPEYIAAGPANTLWFTEKDGEKIGRISGLDIPGGGGQPGGDPNAPAVTGLGMTDTTVVVGPRATPLTGRSSAKTGTTIRYTLSEPATVRLRFDRVLSGRRVGRRCVKPRPTLRNRRRCVRFRRAGSLTRTSRQGRNRVRFSGRIGRRALRRGRHRLRVTATDAAGNRSAPKALGFRVVRVATPRR
jgi:streptogramin lyase